MISVYTYRHLRITVEIAVFAVATVALLALLSLVGAQTRVPKPGQTNQPTAFPAAQIAEPVYREYRGVSVGMQAEQARQKLGTPSESSDRQDFFVFSSAESAQVFYDAQKRVMAVSVNYLGEGTGAPTPEKVFGAPAEASADGSVYKMVRYERAGYFVVYTRTAGDAPPLVSVTMQKIIN